MVPGLGMNYGPLRGAESRVASVIGLAWRLEFGWELCVPSCEGACQALGRGGR